MPRRESILRDVTTVSEAAKLAGVTRGAVHDAIRHGKLTKRYSGSTLLLLMDEVLARWPNAAHHLDRSIAAKSRQP